MCLRRLWICGLVQPCPRIGEMMVGRGVVALWLLFASLSIGLYRPSLPLVYTVLARFLAVFDRHFELRFELRMNIIVALPTLDGWKCFYGIAKEALRVRSRHLIHVRHMLFKNRCWCLEFCFKASGGDVDIRKATKLIRGR